MLTKYQQIQTRNKTQAKLQSLVEKQLSAWAKTHYEVCFIKHLNSKLIGGVIYLYLKNNNIINVNYNKIKLVRDFIVSKKSNQRLRLEAGVYLLKQNKQIKVVRSE